MKRRKWHNGQVTGKVLFVSLLALGSSHAAQPHDPVGAGDAENPAGWPSSVEASERRALGESLPALLRVHLAHQVQAQLGRLAEQRGSTPEVRRFGRLVAADHERTGRALASYAADDRTLDLNALVKRADPAGVIHQRIQRVKGELTALSGTAFDHHFLRMMAGAHDDSLTLLADARFSTQDPELRVLIDRTAPVMQQHQQIAQGLLSRSGMPRS